MKTSIIRSSRKTISMEMKNPEEIIIRAPYHASKAFIDRFIKENESWIRSRAEKLRAARSAAESYIDPIPKQEQERLKNEAASYIPQRAAYFAPLIGVTYGRITIRIQKTRFGSCSAKGNLNFNALLMKMPPEVLDYVVVHELCHRKEMNHSPAFWAEVARILPDYRKRRRWLKTYGRYYIAAAGIA